VSVESIEQVRPLSLAAIGANGGDQLIACVYDPTARRRIAALLRAVALLAPRHPGLRLAIVGPGAEDDDLRMHAAALGITEVVAHVGQRLDQQAVLSAAELAWVAAGGDNAAFGYLDLMALRVPVLAERDALSQRYVADGICGVLLAQPDPGTMAARMAVLLAHKERRSAMGNAGRARVSRDFAEQDMVRRIRARDGDRARSQALAHVTSAPARSSASAVPCSVVIAAKDEAAEIGECIASVAWAAEVIVVENDSTDDTVAVATSAGRRPSATRSRRSAASGTPRSRVRATSGFSWWMPTSVVPAGLRDEVARIVSGEAKDVAFRVRRRNFFLGRKFVTADGNATGPCAFSGAACGTTSVRCTST
jgi:hypothetical protein